MDLLAIIFELIALGDEEESGKIISVTRSNRTIHLRNKSDVMNVAKALDMPVITEAFDSDRYPVRSGITYKGWRIFTIYNIGEE